MLFVVHYRIDSPAKVEQYPCVVLHQDAWDDYGYQTTFQARLHLSAEEEVDLGNVKILKKGQKGGYTLMPKRFKALGADYCSLGGKLGRVDKGILRQALM